MNRLFRTIYVETKAMQWPLTRKILDHFPLTPVVEIRHYKDVFNRPQQNLQLQKKQPALLLAVQEGQLFHKGPPICQHFGSNRFFYASLVQNCLSDCSYCFLQGLYTSGDILAFVNLEDFEKCAAVIEEKGPAYIALSHNTDLLLLEKALPYLQHMAHWWNQFPSLTFEVRTKSADASFFSSYPAAKQLVFAFSLAPQAVIDRYERKTSSLNARLKAALAAQKSGHPVRLCFDPVFCDKSLEFVYPAFFKTVFTMLEPNLIRDVSYGFFRMPKDLYTRLIKRRPDAAILGGQYEEKEGRVSFPEQQRRESKAQHLTELKKYISEDKIFFDEG